MKQLLKRKLRDDSHEQNARSIAYMKHQDRQSAFNTLVAGWAFGLNRWSSSKDEFMAVPKMAYDHEGDADGVFWTLRVGVAKLVVTPIYGYETTLDHIRCSLTLGSTSIYRDYQTDQIEVHRSSDKDISDAMELADLLIAEFAGHAVCDWWPNERQTYARWLADGKPKWKNGLEPHWPTTTTPTHS